MCVKVVKVYELSFGVIIAGVYTSVYVTYYCFLYIIQRISIGVLLFITLLSFMTISILSNLPKLQPSISCISFSISIFYFINIFLNTANSNMIIISSRILNIFLIISYLLLIHVYILTSPIIFILLIFFIIL